MTLPAGWIVPDWPAPECVRAFVTTREGGVSEGEYGTLNLGSESGDDPSRVAANRKAVLAHLPSAPRWLTQVHGTSVANLDAENGDDKGDAPLFPPESGTPSRKKGSVPFVGKRGASPLSRVADAAATSLADRVAVVLTADCLPVFLCREDGSRVGVAHAGWRGLAAGVLENAVAALGGEASRVLAWLGPAIGPAAFEVGPEVREAFAAGHEEALSAFVPRGGHKYMADLYALARIRLASAGVTKVTGGGFCTYTDRSRFFSYRREKKSGRQGAFIWIDGGR